MIKSLYVRDYLLMPEIYIEFSEGLTVFTGETGAGKSLVVDSLALALGARAESGFIRKGCDKAEIFVTFSALDEQVRRWLQQQDYDDGDDCIIRRNLYRKQSTKAFINGRPAPLQALRDLGALLIDIHGQHEQQHLLKPQTQRDILDAHAGQLHSVRELEEISGGIRQQQQLQADSIARQQDLESQSEVLAHQIETLQQLEPADGEFSKLTVDLQKLSHAEETAAGLIQVAQRLFYADESAVTAVLNDCVSQLNSLVQYDESLEAYRDLLEEAKVRVDDAARELQAIADRIEFDPAQIANTEERMAALQQQARIHVTNADNLQSKLDELNQQSKQIATELAAVHSIDTSIQNLKVEYTNLAENISATRNQFANSLSEQVTRQMQHLGMETGIMRVHLPKVSGETFANYGLENVEFQVSTSKGQELGPLSKVASGGELSRLSLALQAIAINASEIPSIVFDEVDVGIGGKVAESVGTLLKKLGTSSQVFCITHLPQVASKGDTHLRVTKSVTDESTVNICQLNGEERVLEIARMLGGAKITDRTIAHAREMLNSGNQK